MGRTYSDIGRVWIGALCIECWMGGGENSFRNDIRIWPGTRVLSLRSLRFNPLALVLQCLSWNIRIWRNGSSWSILDGRSPSCTPINSSWNYWNRCRTRLARLRRPEPASNHLCRPGQFYAYLGEELAPPQSPVRPKFSSSTMRGSQFPWREPNWLSLS